MLHSLLLLACATLPMGPAPEPVAFPHFPDTLHAFVWRNWQLVPLERMAAVVGASPEELRALGESMGLAPPPEISKEFELRSYITVIRRNWHLLPYEQLLELLQWSEEELDYTLQEDDFLFIKLGSLKPQCPPIRYAPPSDAAKSRAAAIKATVTAALGGPAGILDEPLFQFVEDLSTPPATEAAERTDAGNLFDPRFCSSYFALYGDPLAASTTTSYPDGYLARLAQSGVNGVWLQGVLYTLQPFPWQPELSAKHETRLENLRDLVARAGRHGIGVYMYLNEPRSMPLAFFEERPELKGVVVGDRGMLCTSAPEVQEWLRTTVAAIARAVPDLAGFFTITASENPTNCWSHGRGGECPRCGTRGPAAVIAGLNAVLQEGLNEAATGARLIAWDWGWQDDWAPDAIRALPKQVMLQSVSEWSLPIERGGVATTVGEYSISAIGPGPRAQRHWQIAREAGLQTSAKIQAGNTWELSAVPYIPAVARVAQHGINLRGQQLNGIMLGWTLGGYPSPNLEAIKVAGTAGPAPDVDSVLEQVAAHRVAESFYRQEMVRAWQQMSEAFGEFPYHGGTVYSAPLQVGPANLLYATPTGYRASMVGIPYDDVDAWRTVYPAEVFADQMEKVARGFALGAETLWQAVYASSIIGSAGDRAVMDREIGVARAAALHFQSVTQQTRFVLARAALAAAEGADERNSAIEQLAALVDAEHRAALDLYKVQSSDSRIGYEASNHYFYVPLDLAEKIVNCAWLKEHWLEQPHNVPAAGE